MVQPPISNCLSKNKDSESRISALGIAVVIIIGIVLRFIAWKNSIIIDPDGTLYIHQAKAIYFHQWNSLTNCGLNYIANYPFFVAACYYITPNWEVCARSISFFLVRQS